MGLLRRLLPGGASPAAPVFPDALPEGMRIGPWRVVRPLGSGGCGAVYLVRRWGRHYALKLAVRPGDKRLLREGRLLRRVRHPGVVRLRGRGWWLGSRKGFPYLVMEYVEGQPLYTWARGTNPTPRQLAELLAQAALALEAVHRERSVHRDVKGANTLVLPGGRRLVLVDLGAGDYEGATPLTHQVLPPGTEVYLSPEAMAFAQVHSKDPHARYEAGPADDLYALGVMAHRVLTDEYPFPTHMPRDLFWLMVKARPAPSAREVNPRVPAALAAILQRLLAKRPEERFAGAREVAEALRKAVKEGGPEWDEPLFEWYVGPGLASRTTQAVAPAGPVAPGQEVAVRVARAQHQEQQEWLRMRRQVRRRPPGEVQAREPASGSEPSTTLAPGRIRHRLAAGGVLALVLLVFLIAWGTLRHGGSGASVGSSAPAPTLHGQHALPTQGVGISGQEVARPASSPDAGTGAAPFEAATPAPVASAMQPKEDTRVNPPARPATSRGQKKQQPESRPPSGSGKNIAKALPLCLGIACTSGHQAVRQVPPPEECPPGAIETMRELDINVGDKRRFVVFEPQLNHYPALVTVKEGDITVGWPGPFKGLPFRTVISGRLFKGEERFYGRLTVAHLPDERTLPVCMELFDDEDGKRGIKFRPESTRDELKIALPVDMRAVDHFE
jgi:eukaryotic-like serine/threonine-protein kinase